MANNERHILKKVGGSTTNMLVSSAAGSSATELVRDFLVDGLGILLPGLGFLVACIPAVLVPLVWLLFVIARLPQNDIAQLSFAILLHSSVSKQLAGMVSSFHLELFVAFIGLSYVVGHLLFRQDIKEPDKKSFLRTYSPRTTKLVGAWRWVVRLCGSEAMFPMEWTLSGNCLQSDGDPDGRKLINILKPKIPVKIEKSDFGLKVRKGKNLDGMVRPVWSDHDLSHVAVDYPYHFLSEYMTERGFSHLSKIVPWRGVDNVDISRRSKHFINLLKSNLHQSGSVLINTVGKNEAHIRLASSVWYAASYIARLSLLGIALSLLADVLTNWRWSEIKIDFALMSLCTMIVAIFVQNAIEESLHYQRCREIFFVLHAAVLINNEKANVLFGVPNLCRAA